MNNPRTIKVAGLEFVLELEYVKDKPLFEIYFSSQFHARKAILIAGVRGEDAIPVLSLCSVGMDGAVGVERLIGIVYRAIAMAQNEMAERGWD